MQRNFFKRRLLLLCINLKIEADQKSRENVAAQKSKAQKSRLNMLQFIKWFLRNELGNQVQTCFLKRNSDWKAFCVCFGQ